MFRKTCAKCKSHSVNILKSSNGWKTIHQFCADCGTDQTAIGLKKARITRHKPRRASKRTKSTKSHLIAFSFIGWAIFALGATAYAQIQPAPVEKETIEATKEVEMLGISHSALVTGYNSLPEQTDDTPFTTASGQRTRDGIVANNCLKFGSQVVIKGKIYEVQDRMNKRYGCDHYDIWMEHHSDAIKFGAQRLTVIRVVK